MSMYVPTESFVKTLIFIKCSRHCWVSLTLTADVMSAILNQAEADNFKNGWSFFIYMDYDDLSVMT